MELYHYNPQIAFKDSTTFSCENQVRCPVVQHLKDPPAASLRDALNASSNANVEEAVYLPHHGQNPNKAPAKTSREMCETNQMLRSLTIFHLYKKHKKYREDNKKQMLLILNLSFSLYSPVFATPPVTNP